MVNFLKQIFTWWHKQTVGTFIHTLFFGKLVGIDKFGNKYYLSSKGKRWIIYKSNIEATKIPPEWHMWIHCLSNDIPSEKTTKFPWQIEHTENLTGTKDAYKPEGSLTLNVRKNNKKYETWKN